MTTDRMPRCAALTLSRTASARIDLSLVQVRGLGGAQLVAFALFACAAPPAMRHLGTAGLVVANCISMTVRIAYCMRFVSNYFDGTTTTSLSSHSAGKSSTDAIADAPSPLRRALPAPLVAASLAVSCVLTHLSDTHRDHVTAATTSALAAHAAHVARGCGCLGLVVVTFARCERDFVRDVRTLRSRLSNRHNDKQD